MGKKKLPSNWPLGADLKPMSKKRVLKFGDTYLVLKDFRETLPRVSKERE